MRKVFRIITVILTALLSATNGNGTDLTIIHSNDLHSYITGAPVYLNESNLKGGWARIATVIKEEKKSRDNPVLVLDSGDILRGRKYNQAITEDRVAFLLLKRMGYDIISLGNHDFDISSDGLARLLESVHKVNGLPEIVFSNAVFSGTRKKGPFQGLYKKGIIKRYIVKEVGGVLLGIFSVMGEHAQMMTQRSKEFSLDSPFEISRRAVSYLMKEELVDVVICLSHGSTGKSANLRLEDDILAEKVNGIDIIISGHSHTLLKEPKIINGVIIVQAGEFGKHVGVLDLVYDKTLKKGLRVKNYKIVNIDGRIKEDPEVGSRIRSLYKKNKKLKGK